MPPSGHHTDSISIARSAAVRVLDEGARPVELAEQLGIRRTSITQAVARLRDERGIPRPRKGNGGVPAKSTSLQHELGARVRQDGFLVCCQSPDHHRFDCAVRPSGAPYLPVTPMTPAQLIARMRTPRSAP